MLPEAKSTNTVLVENIGRDDKEYEERKTKPSHRVCYPRSCDQEVALESEVRQEVVRNGDVVHMEPK